MLFTAVSVLVLAGALLGLAFHRFRTTREEARSTLLYAELAKKYFAWLALRAIQMSRRASSKAWWEYLKGLPLWRAPVLEKWLYASFYASFLVLAGSGFFFTVFVPRGLYGFPLVGHVMAGGLFAVCLAAVVLFKGREFIAVPEPARLGPRKAGVTAARARRWSFWLFALAGFLLILTALLPMLPLLRTAGQKLMFELHRCSALAALAAAAVFAGLEAFAAQPTAGASGPPGPRPPRST
ncbi:MAG TPA: hypothetical protein PLP83_01510 [Candidatus Aminicenantes bacterium]|nr:hypothetical protein [Candidatus Aminicenantes bacterium]